MRLLFFLILCLNVAATFAQQPFHLDLWLNESRTPLKVNAMMQDSNGYIFLATDEGVLRYNGSSFKKPEATETQPATALGIWNNEIFAGYKDGTAGIISQDSVKRFYIEGDKPRTAAITSITGSSNELWLGTENGIIALSNNKTRFYSAANGISDNFIYSVQSLRPGHFLAATDRGINDITIENGHVKLRIFSASDGLPDNIVRVLKPFPNEQKFWIGTQAGGIAVYDVAQRKIIAVMPKQEWIWGQVNDILPISNTAAWIATEEGHLIRIDLNKGKAGLHPFYFPDKKIKALLQDHAGNLWLGTNKGLTLFTYEYLWYDSLPEPYHLRSINALCFDRNNRLWLALANELFIAEGHTLTPFFRFASAISCMYCDDKNRMWVGTIGDGLWYKDGNHSAFKKITIPGLEQECVLSITQAKGHLWIAGLNGAREIACSETQGITSPAIVKTHNKKSGIGSDYIYQLYADEKERVWMATDGAGVCMYDGSRYHHWDTFQHDNTVVYAITEDIYGNMWAGTWYKNLLRYSGNHWENMRGCEVQDVDVNVFTVAANNTGQVIAVFQRCIDMWYPDSRTYRHFNSRPGMGLDSTSTALNCAARDTSGNVYIPFEKGILIFKNQHSARDIRPNVHICSVKKNFNPASLSNHHFTPNENFISIGFDGICFTNPERLNYRYRLEGYSNQWIPTNEPLVTFPNLPPGHYTFRVRVSLNDDFSLAREAAYYFEIAAPLWQRWWFILPALLLFAATVYLLQRYRNARAKRILQLKQERILFEYEHLKSQVNPHFLFNSLNTLTGLIETSTDDAIAYTEQLSDLYRNMLTYKDKDLIPLSEEWELLRSYLHIQQSRFGKALQVSCTIDEQTMSRKQIVPMSLQLLVENAIKHNVVSMAHPLRVMISSDNDTIIASNKIREKIKKEKSSGVALDNIRKRYALLSKRTVQFGAENGEWVVRLPLL